LIYLNAIENNCIAAEEFCVTWPMVIELSRCDDESPAGFEKSFVHPVPVTPVQVLPHPPSVTIASLVPVNVGAGILQEVHALSVTLLLPSNEHGPGEHENSYSTPMGAVGFVERLIVIVVA